MTCLAAQTKPGREARLRKIIQGLPVCSDFIFSVFKLYFSYQLAEKRILVTLDRDTVQVEPLGSNERESGGETTGLGVKSCNKLTFVPLA